MLPNSRWGPIRASGSGRRQSRRPAVSTGSRSSRRWKPGSASMLPPARSRSILRPITASLTFTSPRSRTKSSTCWKTSRSRSRRIPPRCATSSRIRPTTSNTSSRSEAGWPQAPFGKGERGSYCAPGDPGPLRDCQPGADQRRAGDHLRHDAGDQSRAWRILDARRLCGDRRNQPRHQHLDRDAGGGARRRRHHRGHRGADHHPFPLRLHDRHHAGDLGFKSVSGRIDHRDLRQHHRRHLGPARQFPDRRLSYLGRHAVRHCGGHRRARSDLCGDALDAAWPDRPRHHAERQYGSGARRQSAAGLCRHLRYRRRLVGPCRRGAGAGLRRLPDHWCCLCGKILHHRDRRRRGDPLRDGFRFRFVRHHQPGRDFCHHACVRRGGAARCGHRADPPLAAGHHGPLLPERPVNARTLNLLGLALVGIVGLAFLILTPRFAELDTVLELTVYMIMAILALSLALIWGYGGILCFGQSAFFGLGAYTYAIAMFNMGESTLPLLLAIVVPASFAALLGYFMFYGRISDVYLGVITLTVTLILFNSLNSTAGPEFHIGVARLGGFQGISRIPPRQFSGEPG